MGSDVVAVVQLRVPSQNAVGRSPAIVCSCNPKVTVDRLENGERQNGSQTWTDTMQINDCCRVSERLLLTDGRSAAHKWVLMADILQAALGGEY